MKLSEDFDLKKFLEKLKLLEYIQKNSPCSIREIKAEFTINKSELYRKIEEWASRGLLRKDYRNKERKLYSHFVIRRTPQLKIELLSLYDDLISTFSKKYKRISEIRRVLGVREKISKVNV